MYLVSLLQQHHLVPLVQLPLMRERRLLLKLFKYKKVLLRDRKRRTARGVASLALLSGVGDTPSPVLRAYPLSCNDWVPPPPWAGPGTGPVTGLGGTSQAGPEQDFRQDPPPPERTWDQRLGRGLGPETGVAPPPGGQIENITFPRTSYAGGKNDIYYSNVQLYTLLHPGQIQLPAQDSASRFSSTSLIESCSKFEVTI